MRVYIKGCFQPIPFKLVEYLMNQELEVYGQDEYEEDEHKFERFARVGRHALFHFIESEQETPVDCFYDFTVDRVYCEFTKTNEQVIQIEFEDSNRIHDAQMIHFLASLKDCSILPKHIRINGEDEYSIHFIK